MHFKTLTPSCLLVSLLLTGCSPKTKPTTLQPAQVTVALPTQQQIEDAIELTGTVAAAQSVDLVARVTGYLQSVNFKDGDFVEEGQLLFVIEPTPYEQQLRTAEAVYKLAKQEYDRQLVLEKQGATTPEETERCQSSLDQAAAQVEIAKLNLSYTRVTAPFAGRMSRRLVDKGNLVGPSVNTKLATIQQLTPVYVYCNVNERDTLKIRDAIRQQGNGKLMDVRGKPVQIGLQTEEGVPHPGAIDYVDNGVNTATGTLQVRASFANEERHFMPGYFVRVRIPLGAPRPTLVIPTKALASDQEGDYVLVVDANDTVVRHSIVKGAAVEDGCAIRSGLETTDRVIVKGLMQARPGQKVLAYTATR